MDDPLEKFRKNFFDIIKKENDLSKIKYYPVLLLYRDPYFIYVNKNKWNQKINNFNESKIDNKLHVKFTDIS